MIFKISTITLLVAAATTLQLSNVSALPANKNKVGSATTPASTAGSSSSPAKIELCNKDCGLCYTIAQGDTCDTITKKFGISTQQLETANPGVKAVEHCKQIKAGVPICVKTKTGAEGPTKIEKGKGSKKGGKN